MKYLGLLAVVPMVLAQSKPWGLLPGHQSWKAILESFASTDQIPTYVEVYVAPFEQYVMAERNANITAAMMKTSLLAAFALVQQSCGIFNITADQLQSRDTAQWGPVLTAATSNFDDSPVASTLQPVFTVNSVRNFVFQRFNDLLIASPTYKAFTHNLHSYLKIINNWTSYYNSTDSDAFKYLISRDIDLHYVANYTSAFLVAQRSDNVYNNTDVLDLRWHIHSLGNSATTSRPDSSLFWTVSLSMFVALLLQVL